MPGNRKCAFSLIEVLLVLALFGLIGSVCVINFDVVQKVFSSGNTQWITLIEEAVQEGRLLASKDHCVVFLKQDEKNLSLYKRPQEILRIFPCPATEDACHFVSGVLTENGLLRPSEQKISQIEINPDGFVKSAFVVINGEEEQIYSIDPLTGVFKQTETSL